MRINKPKLLGLSFIHFLLFSLILGISANAQYAPEPALSWGLKGGVNAATLYGDAVDDAETRAGFNGGIYLNYKFAGPWALQPEVLFSMKGADLDNGITGQPGSTEYELAYLEIPVLVKYYIPAGTMLKPNLYAGPEVGFNLYGDANGSDIDDSMEDAEFGLAFGGGLDFVVGSAPTDLIRTVGLDLRYTLGLTNVFDVPGDPDAKNGAFTAVLGIGF